MKSAQRPNTFCMLPRLYQLKYFNTCRFECSTWDRIGVIQSCQNAVFLDMARHAACFVRENLVHTRHPLADSSRRRQIPSNGRTTKEEATTCRLRALFLFRTVQRWTNETTHDHRHHQHQSIVASSVIVTLSSFVDTLSLSTTKERLPASSKQIIVHTNYPYFYARSKGTH